MEQGAFEAILTDFRGVIERFVYCKTPSKPDGEDVLQEVWLAAYRNRHTLRDASKAKAWLLAIAANRCRDFYRRRAMQLEIPYENMTDVLPAQSRYGVTLEETVRETLSGLNEPDKQMLALFYLHGKRQDEIAQQLRIPLGTVKSRLFAAKKRFRAAYPYPPHEKGMDTMQKLPTQIPNVRIEKTDAPIFTVKWEEMMGWFVVPRLGEACNWAMYESP